MYLYIFEDGLEQFSQEPTPDDISSIAEGFMDIVRFRDGKFEQMDITGNWRLIPVHPKDEEIQGDG